MTIEYYIDFELKGDVYPDEMVEEYTDQSIGKIAELDENALDKGMGRLIIKEPLEVGNKSIKEAVNDLLEQKQDDIEVFSCKDENKEIVLTEKDI